MLFGLEAEQVSSVAVLTDEVFVLLVLLHIVEPNNIGTLETHHTFLLAFDILLHIGFLDNNPLGNHLEGALIALRVNNQLHIPKGSSDRKSVV